MKRFLTAFGFFALLVAAWHWACDDEMFFSVAIAADSLAFKRALSRFGIAIDAMMAMIATTIISSMSVKPFSYLDMTVSLANRNWR